MRNDPGPLDDIIQGHVEDIIMVITRGTCVFQK